MSGRRLVIAALAILVGAAGAAEAAAANVRVVNGRGAPALVMDQTVLQPVHGNASVRLEGGQSAVAVELIDPPAGKMVVIEYITIRAFVDAETANALLDLSGDLGEGREVDHSLDAFPPRSA